jgi:hypothetical protein
MAMERGHVIAGNLYFCLFDKLAFLQHRSRDGYGS